MKILSVLLCLFYLNPAIAQFDKLKNDQKMRDPVSVKMQKIYTVDTAVFVLLQKYSSKQISKGTWQYRTSLLVKRYDALGCKHLSEPEAINWQNHKKAMADAFLGNP